MADKPSVKKKRIAEEQNDETVEAEHEQTPQKEEEKTERDTQKMTEGDMQQVKGSGEIRLNIDESDSIEAAVYDLEELIVRIQWIKEMLRDV